MPIIYTAYTVPEESKANEFEIGSKSRRRSSSSSMGVALNERNNVRFAFRDVKSQCKRLLLPEYQQAPSSCHLLLFSGLLSLSLVLSLSPSRSLSCYTHRPWKFRVHLHIKKPRRRRRSDLIFFPFFQNCSSFRIIHIHIPAVKHMYIFNSCKWAKVEVAITFVFIAFCAVLLSLREKQ